MTSEVVDTSGPGPRAARRQSRRRKQRRTIGGAAGAAVLVLLAVTAVLADKGDDVVDGPPAQQRTQSTLLFQVQAPSGAAMSTALLAHDPGSGDDDDAGSGAIVLMPPQLLVTVAGSGQLPLSRALRSVTPQQTRDAVSDLLGVTVDAGWVVDQPSLARLVDGLRGISVDVDVPVLGGVGGRTVLLNPGGQRLDGARTLAFLGYLAPGEPEQARLARLQEVLDGIILGLPRSTADVATLLQALGKRSVPSVPVPKLAELLVGLASDERDDALQYEVLPVIAIDTGAPEPAFRLDTARAKALADRLLAQSVPASARASGNRVLVLNGVGTVNLGEKVRAKLVKGGFVFVGSRNADSFNYATTLVLVPDATPAAQAIGLKVATAIGVPASAVQTSTIGTVADVVVVVGADFKP